ncbi:MAG: S58 family peptidase [Rhodospirillales bacterium]|nr:S58 family peptidase [Rhodospirillales bacterium]
MSDPRTHLPDGRPRARGLGLPFAENCGPWNALTDVAGVGVGYATIIEGTGEQTVGQGPIRTGVTVIRPRLGGDPASPTWAAIHSLNGNGEMTGSHWIEESGHFTGPIAITNTHSVGMVHHAVIGWLAEQTGSRIGGAYDFALPVVAETSDAYLNDMNGRHVTEGHVRAALDSAVQGPLAEGNVGGGTGMVAYEFKAGTGTASRRVAIDGHDYTVGALVQANHGIRPWLSVLGVPVGEHLQANRFRKRESGSIIAVIGMDVPLLPIQLRRMARRIGLGVGRTGTPSGDSSGDIFLAFSTANPAPLPKCGLGSIDFVPNTSLDPVFLAVVEAVEEAIINALVAAQTMTGRDGRTVHALDHAALIDVMRRYGRLST